jgi:hypothetical protein
MSATGALSPTDAAALAGWLLRDDPMRWKHSRGAARRARQFAAAVPPSDQDLLVSAAWLHDIGYAADVQSTGFHPLDGALHLESVGQPVLAALVAHHSGARYVAVERRLSEALARFPFVQDRLTDALTAADQTVDQVGLPITVHERIRDMLVRHGPTSPNARAHHQRSFYLLGAVRRTQQRLIVPLAHVEPPLVIDPTRQPAGRPAAPAFPLPSSTASCLGPARPS